MDTMITQNFTDQIYAMPVEQFDELVEYIDEGLAEE